MRLRHLDLFSGIGGFSLGLEATGSFETVAFCDIEKYCLEILEKRFPGVPRYTNIKELTYDKLKADGIISDGKKIDIITGGYPCQPFSVAGRKKGEEDPRHLWPEYFRLIKELRPDWVIGENVAGHIKLGLDTVLENLEAEGYSARTFSISASSVGANHQRERIWIVANANSSRDPGTESRSTGKENEKEISNREKNSSSRFIDGTNKIFTEQGSETEVEHVVNTSINRRNESKSNKTSKRIVGESKEGRMQQSERTSNVEDTRQHGGGIEPTGNSKSIGRGSLEKTERSTNTDQTSGSSEGKEIVANTDSNREKWDQPEDRKGSRFEQNSSDVANTDSKSCLAGESRRTDREISTKSERLRGGESERKTRKKPGSSSKNVTKEMANTDSERGRSRETGWEDAENVGQSSRRPWDGWWDLEPELGRVAHGIPKRVDRLKCLGNSLVPSIPYYIGLSIIASYMADTDGEKSFESETSRDDGEDR